MRGAGGEAVEETLRGDLGGGLTPHHARPRAGGTADVHQCWVGGVEGDGCCLLVGRRPLAVGVWREAVGGGQRFVWGGCGSDGGHLDAGGAPAGALRAYGRVCPPQPARPCPGGAGGGR